MKKEQKAILNVREPEKDTTIGFYAESFIVALESFVRVIHRSPAGGAHSSFIE